MAADYMLFFHLLFAFLFIGGVVIAQASSILVQREKDIRGILGILRLWWISERLFTLPGFFLASIFGVLTVWKQGWELAGIAWIDTAYLLAIVGFLLGPGFMLRWGIRVHRLAKQAAPTGSITPELRAALTEKAPAVIGMLLNGLLVFMVVLMVFKPF